VTRSTSLVNFPPAAINALEFGKTAARNRNGNPVTGSSPNQPHCGKAYTAHGEVENPLLKSHSDLERDWNEGIARLNEVYTHL